MPAQFAMAVLAMVFASATADSSIDDYSRTRRNRHDCRASRNSDRSHRPKRRRSLHQGAEQDRQNQKQRRSHVANAVKFTNFQGLVDNFPIRADVECFVVITPGHFYFEIVAVSFSDFCN